MPTNFLEEELITIPRVISEPRFRRYLDAENGDQRRALALYRWNSEISGALMFPMHMSEIAVRNGIHGALVRKYGERWPWVDAFEKSLPNPGGRYYNPRKDLQRTRRGLSTTGKLVAELKFAFWENMLTSRHDGRLWRTYLVVEFSGLPQDKNFSANRRHLHEEVEIIRNVRNRIAHHEPIFTRDLIAEYEIMIDVIKCRCPQTAQWVERTQKVVDLITERP